MTESEINLKNSLPKNTMQKICSRCGEITYQDGDLHCRKIFKDKIYELIISDEVEKAKILFLSTAFDATWKKHLLNQLGIKGKSGKELQYLIREEMYPTVKDESFNQAGNSRRITHCWYCNQPLDSSADAECGVCHWLICKCGSCRCPYPFS